MSALSLFVSVFSVFDGLSFFDRAVVVAIVISSDFSSGLLSADIICVTGSA